MPYKSKGKKDCTQSDGSKGKYQTVKKNGTKRCYKSKKQYDAAMAWAHEADEAEYGEEINEDIARILIGDFTIAPTLEEKKEVKYKPSCAYEIKVNRILENAGLRGPYTFDSSKTGFCFGTDAGADSEFMNAAGKVFNMELKDGSGQGAAPMEDVFRQPAIEILAEVSSYNTVENIEAIIKAQVSKSNFQGLNINRSKTYTDLELTENDIRVLATEIQSRQEAQITEAKNALSKPGAKIPGVSLYYYFGRIDRSTSSLGFSIIPAGTFSDREAGVSIDSWSSHYAANSTYYIHIGQGGGLYYMSSDPANLSLPVKDGGLGIPNFQSNVNLSSRLRFDASSSKSPVGGAGYPDIVTESGVSIKLYGRLFGFSPTVDLGSFTASPINVEDPKSIPRIKKALGYPASMEESIARVFLEEALLLEATKGDKYEKNLISASQSSPHANGFYLDESEINPSSGKPTLAYDLSVKNESGDIVSTVEVKLNSAAQLGKLGKKYFKSLTYTVGGEFDCVPSGSDTTANLLLTVFDSLNKIEKSLERMENFCIEALGKSPGDIVDLTTTYPIPRGTKLSSPKQITSSSKVVNLRIPGEKLVAYHAPKKDYFILGFDEIEPKGIFCVLGEDKLNLFKSGGKMNFGEVNIEIKWGSKSGKAEPNPSHSFVIETRASDPNILDGSMGYRFSNGKQLNDIINGTYSERMQSIQSRETERASGLDNIASQSALAALDNPYHPLHISDVKKFLGKIIKEILEDHISNSDTRLIIEELTGADKSEIKRMISKEIEGASNKRETKKIFQSEFNKELKKALGTSFIGEPGKINKFVGDTIQKEVEKMFKDKATQNEIGEITKAVIKKLYRELSYSSVHIVDRIKL